MDVTNAEQARIAEDAGACAVMALERVPADIRRDGGVARMADPTKIERSRRRSRSRSWPRRASATSSRRRSCEALDVDYIDESEVLTPADEQHHIDKWDFKVPFVCGATNLGEALRRISEGAAMIRTKGEAGTGNVVEAIRHMRAILGDIRRLRSMDENELYAAAKELGAPIDLVRSGRERPAPGRDLLRRRPRHPGRRRPDDAARRRRRLRRLGHLQVRRSGAARRGDRRRRRRTTTTRPSLAEVSTGPRRAHGRHRDRRR